MEKLFARMLLRVEQNRFDRVDSIAFSNTDPMPLHILKIFLQFLSVVFSPPSVLKKAPVANKQMSSSLPAPPGQHSRCVTQSHRLVEEGVWMKSLPRRLPLST